MALSLRVKPIWRVLLPRRRGGGGVACCSEWGVYVFWCGPVDWADGVGCGDGLVEGAAVYVDCCCMAGSSHRVNLLGP